MKAYGVLRELVDLEDDEIQAVLLAATRGGDLVADRDIAVGAGFMAGRMSYRYTNFLARVGP